MALKNPSNNNYLKIISINGNIVSTKLWKNESERLEADQIWIKTNPRLETGYIDGARETYLVQNVDTMSVDPDKNMKDNLLTNSYIALKQQYQELQNWTDC